MDLVRHVVAPAATLRIAAVLAVLALGSSASAQTEVADEEKIRRNAFTLEPTMMFGGNPPRMDFGGIYQYQRAITPQVTWLAGLKGRLIAAPLSGGEDIGVIEAAGGARYFPGGKAPEGFYLGGHASLGFGHWVDRTSTFFGGTERILDEGDGVTWSSVGQVGWLWVLEGFAIGLHLDFGAGTTSLQEGRSGFFGGLGYSIGGAW